MGKQPTCVSTIPETNSRQQEHGALELCGAIGKQRDSKGRQQGEHRSKGVDRTCAAWRMRKRELVFSVSDEPPRQAVLALWERTEIRDAAGTMSSSLPACTPPLLVFT